MMTRNDVPFPSPSGRLRPRRAVPAAILAALCWLAPASARAETVDFDGMWSKTWDLEAGESVQILVGIVRPGRLPDNARIEARWSGPPTGTGRGSESRGDLVSGLDNGWTKDLHALDPDVFLLYRAPVSGPYELRLETVTARVPAATKYHRDSGLAPLAAAALVKTTAVNSAEVRVEVEPVQATQARDILVETEPNNTPEQAIKIPFGPGDDDQTLRIVGGADDLEYFDNGLSGRSPDDWYRFEYRGSRTKLLTANLQLADPVVSARIRVYQPGVPTAEELKPREAAKRADFGNNNAVPYIHPDTEAIPGSLPVYTYYDGRDVNERLHQQDDNFRSFVTRRVHPGGTYYLRVEANQPGYELEVRLVDPAPFDSPQRALKQSIYYHLAEVDAWLIHRPRNIAVHRRVRDSSSLFGENCMSCHTQSGVWGVADALRHGYRPDGTVQNHRRLVNTMYESLRPTNELVDAAVNTSLAPNDLGDAPAGSRVAGRNVVQHERTFRPKRLHSYQQRRTANYVLQTADPKGINAAGKGSNFGPNVVFKFAAEILERAWRDSGEERYLAGVVDKAEKIVATGDQQLRVVDDLGHRIEFFHDLLPRKELAALDPESELGKRFGELLPRFERQVERDLQRLLTLQQDDGAWGFDLGVHDEASDTWTRIDEPGDAAPTAVALIALRAAGHGPDSAPVARAVDWLLRTQFEYGLWNRSAQTGFVTNAYVIRALSRLFPGDAKPFERADFEPRNGEAPLDRLSRVRALQATGRADFADLMIEATGDEMPQVRYYGYLGLGGALAPAGIPAVVSGLSDPVKACREAAFWSLRQLLLDDQGWPAVFAAYRAGDERARQSLLQALVMRVDLLGPRSQVDRNALADLLTEAMRDPFAGVRAYAFKAAWHWWVWNPPLRQRINKAWVRALLADESSAHAENALRYSTVALLITNGQIANQTGTDNRAQQYRELEDLYRMLASARRAAGERRDILDQRLAAVAATHFQERGGDGGPGQMGYSTPGATELLGDVVLSVYKGRDDAGRVPWRSIALQGAANVNYPPLQEHLVALLHSDDIEQVAAAAKALSNPSALRLPGRSATIRPLLAKLDAFLAAGRRDDAEALVRFLSRVRWEFPEGDAEAEREFYELLVPRAERAPRRGRSLRARTARARGGERRAGSQRAGGVAGRSARQQPDPAPAGGIRPRGRRRALLAAVHRMDAALPGGRPDARRSAGGGDGGRGSRGARAHGRSHDPPAGAGRPDEPQHDPVVAGGPPGQPPRLRHRGSGGRALRDRRGLPARSRDGHRAAGAERRAVRRPHRLLPARPDRARTGLAGRPRVPAGGELAGVPHGGSQPGRGAELHLRARLRQARAGGERGLAVHQGRPRHRCDRPDRRGQGPPRRHVHLVVLRRHARGDPQGGHRPRQQDRAATAPGSAEGADGLDRARAKPGVPHAHREHPQQRRQDLRRAPARAHSGAGRRAACRRDPAHRRL